MLTRYDRWTNGVGLASTLGWMEELRRDMDRMFEDFERSFAPSSSWLFGNVDGWPDFELLDEGERFVIRAEVPGMKESDLEVTYDRGAVSIRGRRDASVPEGWTVHRKERASYELSRMISLPAAIDPDGATATLKAGVLEIVLPKAPEARPRRLEIKSGAAN